MLVKWWFCSFRNSIGNKNKKNADLLPMIMHSWVCLYSSICNAFMKFFHMSDTCQMKLLRDIWHHIYSNYLFDCTEYSIRHCQQLLLMSKDKIKPNCQAYFIDFLELLFCGIPSLCLCFFLPLT